MSKQLFHRAGPAAVFLAALLAGCGGGGSPTSAPEGGVVVGAPAGGIVVGAPNDTSVRCGNATNLFPLDSRVHVSSTQGTDSSACGQTPSAACRTIQQGIVRCSTLDGYCGVLVQHGLYPTTQPLRLADGVAVFASCRFDGERDMGYRSVLRPAPGVTQAVVASGLRSPRTGLTGLVVVGADSPPSTANIGLLVDSSPGLFVRDTVVIAGKGGDGADPASADGEAGGPGGASNDTSLGGGAAGGRACPAQSNASVAWGEGGHGGDGMSGYVAGNACDGYACGCRIGNPDAIGGGRGFPNGSNGIAGGSGGDNGALPGEGCIYPRNGSDFYGRSGSTGSAGRCAAAGGTRADDVWGPFTAGVWSPTSGLAGAAGEIGSGGGGGSSGGFCVKLNSGGLTPDYIVHGVPGGGGGGGGCGGGGGRGGLQGGPSIAVFFRNMTADAVLRGNGWAAAPGGRGGNGGAGGAGGAGGPGGALGRGLFSAVANTGATVACPAPSGGGGAGGAGGAGSGGAGGNGGASIAVALTGGAAVSAAFDGDDPGLYLAPPGLGGAPGPGGTGSQCNGGAGEAGLGGAAGAVVTLDSLPRNVVVAGESLGAGQSRSSPDGVYTLKMQTDDNLCFYVGGVFRWCTLQSYGATGVRAEMGTDGNLCLRNRDGGAPWCAGTAGHPGAYLAIGNDGSVVVRDGSTSLATLP